MGVRITVGEGEDLGEAWKRFERTRHLFHRRPWTKRRFGYHEKPCVLRRREDRLRQIRREGGGWYHRFPVDLDAQLRREGPSHTIGR